MRRDAAEILKEALARPARDREGLAESLFTSLDAHLDEDAESVWGAEIDLRVAELDAGAVSTIRLA